MGQYQAAAALGAQLGTRFEGNISGIGHSLGGSLDTVAALSGEFSGVNFNPAGVNPLVAYRLNIDLGQASQSITSYSVPGDPLSRLLNRLPLVPDTDGSQIMLADPGDISYAINRHSMDDTITSIQNEMTAHGCN